MGDVVDAGTDARGAPTPASHTGPAQFEESRAQETGGRYTVTTAAPPSPMLC